MARRWLGGSYIDELILIEKAHAVFFFLWEKH
jgi:hypothetical protein